MPNHIQNILVIEGHESQIQKLLSRIKGAETVIDFNNIIPMPMELRGTSSPARIVSENEYTGKENHPGIGRGITEKMSKDFIKRFGHNDWYGWANANWGTKWGAYDTSVDEAVQVEGKNKKSVTIRFQTAWSSGVHVINYLAHQFPEVDFFLSYADEDCGSNTGQYWWNEGKLSNENLPKNGSNEAMELYFSCWDNDREGWEKIDGEWKHTAEW